MEQKRVLGKGLSSLIPVSNKTTDNTNKIYFECRLEDIIPNPNQPRKLFNKEAIDELAASIEMKGIIQPLVVRKLGGGKYELVAGERRYRASQQLGLETVPVIVKEVDENETLELALIENIQRQDLNPIEEALAYKELLSRYQYTQDELAKQIGKDRSSIANSLRLLKLPDKIRNYLIENQLSMGHARALLAIDNKELQIQIANDVVHHNLSVREIEGMMKKLRENPLEEAAVVLQKSEKSTPRDPVAESEKYKSIEDRLKDQLQTMIKIKTTGEDRGHLIISFNNEQELNSFVEKLITEQQTSFLANSD